MDSNATGESVSNLGGAVSPVHPSASTSPDLSKLESVLATVKAEAEAQSRLQTPQEQFNAQFGLGTTQPVTETPVSKTATSSPDAMRPDEISTITNLPDVKLPNESSTATSAVPLENPNSTASSEVAPQLEQTPAEKLKRQISDGIDRFLAEVLKEKAAV